MMGVDYLFFAIVWSYVFEDGVEGLLVGWPKKILGVEVVVAH